MQFGITRDEYVTGVETADMAIKQLMVRLAGIEPTTLGFGGHFSHG